MVQAVVDETGWKIGDKIEIGFIEKARCILLRSVKDGEGFRLAYSDARKKTGGRVNCKAFSRNYLQTLVELPLRNVVPVFPKNSDWTMVLVLEPISWQREEFSKAGANKIPKDTIGIYELLGSGDAVLRVGEGKIKERISAHLNDKRFSPPTVKAFRYLDLGDPDDGKILEKVRIEEYERTTGVLPRFQEIRA
jgi:hypothetical protein